MHLKTLSLAGFKSFADRTRLVFEPGVTVVVGPNGSGKSNLVDAIAWVMGTQATSTLRTEQMADVIFAGTATRPALGRAEVSLTLDNADGSLPLDLAEVIVTRRLLRDGTSEYAINGTSCRLLDVQELLSDGGVGRHQHILVGQGRVDAVLSAGPEEHRAVIEEAAGVIKHRQRRDRSVRRLEATEIDLHRLHDLLGEQQRRMRPLRRQARAAERYDGLDAEWRSLRLWVGAEQLRKTRARIAEVAGGEQELKGRLAADELALSGAVDLLASLHREAGETGKALDRDTVAAARLETAAERIAGIARVARERRVALVSRLEGAGERRSDLEAEAAELRERIAATLADERAARLVAERQEMVLRSLEDEERSLAEQDTLPAEGVIANLRGDLAALDASERRDQQEAESLERRRGIVTARIGEDDAEVAALQAEIREADSGLEASRRQYESAAADRAATQASFDAATDEAAAARLEAAAAEARVEALEGVVAGSRDPEARARAEAHAAVRGPVAALLDVPDRLVKAVDAALGPWSDALATAAPEGVAAVVASLKGDGLGGVALVHGRAGAGVEVPGELDRLVDGLGPGADRHLAEALLGDVVVVEAWHTAWEIGIANPRLRVVTLEGDLIDRSGMRIAHPRGAGHAALEAARAGVDRAATRVARAVSRVNAARRAFESSRGPEREALEQVEEIEARIAGATEALRLVERARHELEAENARLDDRAAALAEAAAIRTERRGAMRTRLDAFEGEEAARQAAWEALARQRAEIARRRDAARRTREASAGALAAVEERRALLERRLERVTGEAADLDLGPGDPADVERLTAVEGLARRAVEAIRARIDLLRDRQRRLRSEAGDVGAGIEAAEADRARTARSIAETRERLASLAVEAAELRVREESVAEGLRRDVDADEETALAAPRPEVPDGVAPADHLGSLDAERKRIGPINPLAAAEYRELEERASFLEGQLTDLEQSRSELRKVIDALDQEISRLFTAACDDIAVRFSENFGILFPGGTGRLSLTDPDSPLTSGVDIHAQPMGKKVGKLALLSGGERSLAALAFLFAVFRARPSPFYVLDEVEAALDDANLRRFLRLVATMRDTAQLVIVTHQQQTMEAADVLYGVTMEPGESSRVLAKRLTPAEVGLG